MDGLSRAEYRVLRETIAARGSLRPALFLAGLGLWAALLILLLALVPNPILAAVPLLVLVATFEAIRALHVGVERIGRYLQVYFEEARPGAEPRPIHVAPAWERTAMAFGGTVPGAGGHPLFLPVFLMATATNLLAVLLPGPLPVEITALAIPHAAFVVWMVWVDRGVRRQRAADLARYRELE